LREVVLATCADDNAALICRLQTRNIPGQVQGSEDLNQRVRTDCYSLELHATCQLMNTYKLQHVHSAAAWSVLLLLLLQWWPSIRSLRPARAHQTAR
jgi:hypothetical protein